MVGSMVPYKKSKLIVFSLILVTGVVIASWSMAEFSMSDSEKKQKVESMYENYKKSFPEVEDVSAERVLSKLGKGENILFVDVRKRKEQAVSMLPGAVTDQEYLKNPEVYKDRLVIGYCTISYRSGNLAKKLNKKGIPMVNLRGGILAWLHAGGKIYNNADEVKRVHVYGRKWNLAPSEYEAFW